MEGEISVDKYQPLTTYKKRVVDQAKYDMGAYGHLFIELVQELAPIIDDKDFGIKIGKLRLEATTPYNAIYYDTLITKVLEVFSRTNHIITGKTEVGAEDIEAIKSDVEWFVAKVAKFQGTPDGMVNLLQMFGEKLISNDGWYLDYVDWSFNSTLAIQYICVLETAISSLVLPTFFINLLLRK